MNRKNSERNALPLVLTMGDPAGISCEITAKAWLARNKEKLAPFFVLSRTSLYEHQSWSQNTNLPVEQIEKSQQAREVFAHALPVMALPETVTPTAGKADPGNGKMIMASISGAVKLVQEGQASALVTNPINKHVLYQAGFEFAGHTEYLAELAKREKNIESTTRPVMMLVCSQLRTVPLTIHVPLRDVADLISIELITETARIISHDMKKYFGLKNPRLCFAGLNPHAGESGSMGHTEIKVIEPALELLRSEGLNISGPWPADTLFHQQARQNYDVVIGMYHDQALIPIKTLGFDEGVNTTLGLPFVRTSPDHGTAYNIAGKGVASARSLIQAIKLASNMAQQAGHGQKAGTQ